MKNGLYKTAAGSTVEINGLRTAIIFDWFEEPGACCDCHSPYLDNGGLMWDCDECTGGKAGLVLREKMKTTERAEQVAVFQWIDASIGKYPALKNAFHPANGGKRHIGVARKMKAEGVRRGVPDIILLYPTHIFNGLAIEMKIKGNYPTKEQKEWMERLKVANYKVALCYSADEAIAVLINYLWDVNRITT